MTVNRLENEQAISGNTASPPRLESSPCSEGDPGPPSQKFKIEWPQAKDAVTTYLEGQRWFGAKDRSAEDVTLSSSGVLEAEDRRWLFALIAIAYDGARPDRYFIPLGACGDEESLPGPEITRLEGGLKLYDAAAEPAFVRAVLDAIRGGVEVVLDEGRIRFSSTPALARYLPATGALAIRPMGAEQSNSSVVIERCGVLKLYRRVHFGIAPEIEMVRFLTERGYEGAPPLLGAIEITDGRSDASGLGVLIAWVPNEGDAWEGFALDHLRRALRPQSDPERNATFFGLVTKLGRRTAELHRALCPAEAVNRAFDPEPTTAADIENWRSRIRAEAKATLRKLDGIDSAEGRSLLDRGEMLLRHIDNLALRGVEAAKTRIHGDYHLGQVLFTGDDFRIVDFEGEPLRSITERRAKHSPLKDVAGMLRSFDYAAATALKELQSQGLLEETMRIKARGWRDHISKSFLGSYRAAIAGCPSYPTDEATARELLLLLLLEKALYEIAYELANRPDWATIPIAGVLDLLDSNPSTSALSEASWP